MSMGKITGIIHNRQLSNETARGFKKNQVKNVSYAEKHEFTGKLRENSLAASLTKAKLFALKPTNSAASATFTAEGIAGKYDPKAKASSEPDAAPTEVAQYLLRYEHNFGGTAYPGKQQIFLKALAEHKNDPEWTREFFRALGSGKTSELLSSSVTSGVHRHSSPEQIESEIGALRDALAALACAEPPLFTQADMDMLVEKMIKAPGALNGLVAIEIFGKMDSGAESVKNMFFDSAMRFGFGGKLGADEARELMTAAAHVLASTSAENQAEKLNAVRASGEGNLGKFVKTVMSGETVYPPLAAQVEMVNGRAAQNEPYGRIDALLMNVAYAGYHDAHSLGPDVSAADLEAVRVEMFGAAAQNLTNGAVSEKYKDSQLMKDGLAQIFMRDFDRLMSPPNVGENGAILSTGAQNTLSQFFEYALFSVKPCSQQKILMSFLSDQVEQISEGLNDDSPGAEDRFRARFGRSRADAASIMGGLLGTLTIGLRDNNNEIKKNAEAQGEFMGFLFDLTIGNIPGVGGKLSKDLTDHAKKLLGTVTDDLQSEVIEKLKTGAVEEAKKAFIEGNRTKDPQELLLGLYEGLKTTIPNGDNPGDDKFLSDFLDGYSEVINNPQNVVSGN